MRSDSPIGRTLHNVHDHLEASDPQPSSIMITEGHVTMTMCSLDDLLGWVDILTDHGADDQTPHKWTAERLWKQQDQLPSPTVITLDYVWDDDPPPVRYRLCATSPHTMDQLADVEIDERIEVTRSQVETLMLQGYGPPT